MLKKAEQYKGNKIRNVSKLPIATSQLLINRRFTTVVSSSSQSQLPTRARSSVAVSSLPGFLRPTLSSIAKTKVLRCSQKEKENNKKVSSIPKEKKVKMDQLRAPPINNQMKKSNVTHKTVEKKSMTECPPNILQQDRAKCTEQEQPSDMDQSEQTTSSKLSTSIEACREEVEENTYPLMAATGFHSPEDCPTMTEMEETFSKFKIGAHTTPIHTTPLRPTRIQSTATTKRTLNLAEKIISSSDSPCSPYSPKSNSKSYSFNMTGDESTLADIEGYDTFSTSIKNYSSALSSNQQGIEEDSIYFTPCGEI